jgi:excisionase family DNA binding protein
MASVAEQTISVSEAAERLGISTEDAYELVFARRLRTVETATGRRVVPVGALDQFRTQQESADEPV